MSDSMKELKEELFGIEEVTKEMRQYHFDITGQYASDSEVLRWFNATPSFKPSGVEFNQAYDECIKIAESCKYDMVKQPKHYDVGIDTFQRMRANATFEEAMGFIRWNIDKYNIRKKGCDKEDYTKIKAYCDEAIWWLDNREQINND